MSRKFCILYLSFVTLTCVSTIGADEGDNRRWNSQSYVNQNYSYSRQNREGLRAYARKFLDQRRPLSQDEINRKTSDFKNSYGQREKIQRETSRNLASQIKSANPNYINWSSGKYNWKQQHPHHVQYNNYWGDGLRWNHINNWLGWGPSVYPSYYDNGYAIPLGADWQDYFGYYGSNGYPSGTYDNNFRSFEHPMNKEQKWLPIGIYALGADASKASNSTIFMQLLINKEGDLSGTYFNSTTNQSLALEGYVDPATQHVYWQVPDGSTAPEMSTGLFNLTQDVTNIDLTFPGGPIQNWVLVKIDD